jgi:hypothetical protein
METTLGRMTMPETIEQSSENISKATNSKSKSEVSEGTGIYEKRKLNDKDQQILRSGGKGKRKCH